MPSDEDQPAPEAEAEIEVSPPDLADVDATEVIEDEAPTTPPEPPPVAEETPDPPDPPREGSGAPYGGRRGGRGR